MNNGQAVSYDANSLQTDNIITNTIDHASLPTKSATAYGVSHANYSTIPYVNYPSKIIPLSGTLIADSIAELDGVIDTFKGYFIGKDKNLDIGYGNGTRRYIGTASDLSIQRPGGLLYAPYSLNVFCAQPFGRDTTTTTALSATGRTLAVYADSHDFAGTAPFQLPVITITYTAISGGTTKTISFGNGATGQQISVTRTWVANDVYQIDGPNKLVLINGESVDFTGAFPEFPPGSQSMAYSDGLTTRTFNINVAYYPLWL